jgi:hypothetical protein
MSSHGCAVSCRPHAAVRDHGERRRGSRTVLPAHRAERSIGPVRAAVRLNTRHAEFRNERGDFACCSSIAARDAVEPVETVELIRVHSMIVQKKGAGADLSAGSRSTCTSRYRNTRWWKALARPKSQRLARDLLFLGRVERRVPRVVPLRVRPVLRRPPARFRPLLRPVAPLRARPPRALFPDVRARPRPAAARDDRRRAVPARPRPPERRRLRVFVRALRFFLLRLARRVLGEASVLPAGMSSSRSRPLSNRSP